MMRHVSIGLFHRVRACKLCFVSTVQRYHRQIGAPSSSSDAFLSYCVQVLDDLLGTYSEHSNSTGGDSVGLSILRASTHELYVTNSRTCHDGHVLCTIGCVRDVIAPLPLK